MLRNQPPCTQDDVVRWVQQTTASQGLPEKIADATILRKVAILLRPALATGSPVMPRAQSPKGRVEGSSLPTPGLEPVSTQTAPSGGSVLTDLTDAECVQLERAATRLLQALEARHKA
jgi:hypothetical protein